MSADKKFLERTDFGTQVTSSELLGVIGFDDQLRVRAWNRVMEELSGLAAKDVLGEEILNRFPWLRRNGDDTLFTKPLEGESGTKLQRPYDVQETGRKGRVDCAFRPVHDADGGVTGGILEVQDVQYWFRKYFDEYRLEPESVDEPKALEAVPFAQRLGALIQKRRKMLGLSQEKFASLCDMHRTYITDIERGARNVALKNLVAMARALQLPPWVLLGCVEIESAE